MQRMTRFPGDRYLSLNPDSSLSGVVTLMTAAWTGWCSSRFWHEK